MTTYGLIFDSNRYQFAEIQAQEKKHIQVRLLDEKTDKKIKPDNLIITFQKSLSDIQVAVESIRAELDLDLLWELSSDKHYWSLDELSELYFANNEINSLLGLFLATCEPAIFFSYQHSEKLLKRHSSEEITERKVQYQRQQEYQQKFNAIYDSLLKLEQPNWEINPLMMLHKPDKNSLEYKALNKASKDLKLSLLELLFKLGYINSIEELLEKNFIRQYFPNGTELANFEIVDHAQDLPLNPERQVFSIDELMTTEIDDAFSISKHNDGWLIGIHISAPALNQDLLDIASERLSTVYYPGHKITMLPENVIAHYSLDQGKELPVVSIYFALDSELNILEHYSQLERVIVKDNLRTENLELYFNHDNLSQEHGYPYEQELKLLYKFALKLEESRGKSSVNQLMVDYSFAFSDDGRIQIKPRLRGNPIDKLVSELMILANCSWGRMLTNSFVPAIYRVKQPMQPVVMTLTPNSHTGLNVDYYTWASSPLRRAVDLVNQSQIISLLQKQKPLSATDYAVANVVENFDDVYGSYLKFQDSMERYWSLRYLEQENITKIKAVFTYRNNVQLDGIPLVLDVSTITKAQPAGSEIWLRIDNINFVNQTFEFKLTTEEHVNQL